LDEKVEIDVTKVEGVVKPEAAPEATAETKDVKAEPAAKE